MKHIKTATYASMSYSIYDDGDWFFGFVNDERQYPIRVRFAPSIKICEEWIQGRIRRYEKERTERDEYHERVNQDFLFRTN